MAWTGNWAGPNGNYRVWMDIRTSTQGEASALVQVRRCVEVRYDLYGSHVATSWAGTVRMYGPGDYADSGWVDVGWYSYGDYVTLAAEAHYTSSSGAYNESSVTARYSPAVPVWTPNAPTGLTVARESDSKVALAWTNGPTASRPYHSVRVERRIDGGSWSQIASLSGSAASYADASCQPNHAYAYRVPACNSAACSGYATSGTVYNTPAAPASVTASRKTGTTVALSIDNPANTATALDLQRSPDGSAWADVRTVEGSPVTEAEDSPGGGTWYYRARNARGALASAWSPASNAVVTIVAPAAPTLLEPVSGTVVPKTRETVAFRWQHNPIDGSAQTAAQLQTSTDGGATWTTTYIVGAAQEKELANSFAVNSEVVWRVRTKGAHANHGAWSANRMFAVKQVPTVVVTCPAADGDAVADVPIEVAWSYGDQSGEQQQATVTVVDAAGAKVFERTVQGAARSLAIGTADVLLPNASSFALTVAVTSTSSLQARAARSFRTDYEEPATPFVTAEVDPATGSVAVTCAAGPAADGVPATASLGMFRREPGGRLVCLADHVPSGSGATDPYPPLDRGLSYVAVAYTANGLASQAEAPARVPSGGFVFFNFGADRGYSDVAKVAMDAAWASETEADSELFATAADEDPLVFFGAPKRTEGDVTGSVWWRPSDVLDGSALATAADFERMRADVGVKVVRYPYGDVVPAIAVCRIATAAANPLVSSVEVSVRRVRGDGLVL